MNENIIAKLRRRQGWSQTFLAKKLNVSDKTIKNWESNASAPSAENIIELANVFGISADNILGIASSSVIILDFLKPEDQKKLRAIFQAYISTCHESENVSCE